MFVLASVMTILLVPFIVQAKASYGSRQYYFRAHVFLGQYLPRCIELRTTLINSQPYTKREWLVVRAAY